MYGPESNGLILNSGAFGQQRRKAVIAIEIPGIVTHGQVNTQLHLIEVGIVIDNYTRLPVGILRPRCQHITHFDPTVNTPKLMAFGRRGAPTKFDGEVEQVVFDFIFAVIGALGDNTINGLCRSTVD